MPKDPNTLTAMGHSKHEQLGVSDAGVGLIRRSAVDNRQTLAFRTELFGLQEVSALMSRIGLASVLQDLDKCSKAEEMIREALEGRPDVLGVQHLDILMSKNDLASVLWARRKHDGAEELNRRTLHVEPRYCEWGTYKL